MPLRLSSAEPLSFGIAHKDAGGESCVLPG